jgi:hypothetical protein
MNEKELGKALLRLDEADFGGVPDTRRLARRIIERGNRRVRLFTGLTILLWLLATLMICTVLVAFGFLMPMEAKLLHEIDAGKVTVADRQLAERHIMAGFQKGTLLTAFSVAILALAALCTVVLLFVSRRATLRQLNAGLLEVAEQLKLLRQAQGK